MIRWQVINHLTSELPSVVNIDVFRTWPGEPPSECVWLDSPRAGETGVPTMRAGRLDLDDEFVVPLEIRVASKLTEDDACNRVQELCMTLIEWVTTYSDLDGDDVFTGGFVASAVITGIEGPTALRIPEAGVVAGAEVLLTVHTRIGADT